VNCYVSRVLRVKRQLSRLFYITVMGATQQKGEIADVVRVGGCLVSNAVGKAA